MTGASITDINHFYIAGINYKKTDVSIRGKFAINTIQYQSILEKAQPEKHKELFVLSTCNRTEIYGTAAQADDLIQLLCSETEGDAQTFRKLAYVKKGKDAIEHLFSVGAGLDSQILGDYEIIGQLKQAAKFSKEKGFIGTFMERLINGVLQSSKFIKSNTELSSGTVSVSFAAVQFLRHHIADIRHKTILLIGAGKIGRNTCKYLVSFLDANNITIVNRTDETARELAALVDIQHAPYASLQEQIDRADVVLVSTNAETPLILPQHIRGHRPKVLIDLSIPNNIDISVKRLDNVTLINVDELSKQKDETLQKRKAEIPQAKAIIAAHMADFSEWHAMRRNVPVLKAVKQKLQEIRDCELFGTTYDPVEGDPGEAIQKVINTMAVKLRQQNTKGCQYIEAINDYITAGTNS